MIEIRHIPAEVEIKPHCARCGGTGLFQAPDFDQAWLLAHNIGWRGPHGRTFGTHDSTLSCPNCEKKRKSGLTVIDGVVG